MLRNWPSVANADPDLVICAIKDAVCLHLWQEVMPGGVEAVDPEEETPSGYEFLWQLPEQKHKAEEKVLIITTLDYISEAQAHMSMATMNLSSLVKVMDWETFRLVLKATVCPMVQLNIQPQFLDPVRDPEPMWAAEQCAKKLEAWLVPHGDAASLSQEPKNNLTKLLAAALWLKLKLHYLNYGMAKEVCETFSVMAKMLSKILLGKTYLGRSGKRKGTKERLRKRKSEKSDTRLKKLDDDDDDNNQLPAPKEARSMVKGRPN